VPPDDAPDTPPPVELDPPPHVVSSRPLRWLWFCAGWGAVGLGSLGIVVPGLPTTVFFIIAAYCFSRSSPRFEAWVLSLPKVGQMVADHRDGLGMSRVAKRWAVGSVVFFSALSALLLRSRPAISIAIAALGVVGVAYIVWRVPNRARVLAARGVPER
jgi:uncharacterized membrane protein YbaN (DUF454 family)